MAAFEPRNSNAKTWTNKFFFLVGRGWEFSASEKDILNFPIQVNWRKVPDDKKILIDLTDYE